MKYLIMGANSNLEDTLDAAAKEFLESKKLKVTPEALSKIKSRLPEFTAIQSFKELANIPESSLNQVVLSNDWLQAEELNRIELRFQSVGIDSGSLQSLDSVFSNIRIGK